MSDADVRDLDLVEMAEEAAQPKKSSNDCWNEHHIQLVKELEKKGTLSRYSVKHLKVWTDCILEGKSAGVGDEPNWGCYIDLVGVPPKKPHEKGKLPVAERSDSSPSTGDLLKALMIQNQQTTEFFQTSLLAILTNQHAPVMQQQVLYILLDFIFLHLLLHF